MSPFLFSEGGIRHWVFTLLTQASLEMIRCSKPPMPDTLVLSEFQSGDINVLVVGGGLKAETQVVIHRLDEAVLQVGSDSEKVSGVCRSEASYRFGSKKR